MCVCVCVCLSLCLCLEECTRNNRFRFLDLIRFIISVSATAVTGYPGSEGGGCSHSER